MTAHSSKNRSWKCDRGRQHQGPRRPSFSRMSVNIHCASNQCGTNRRPEKPFQRPANGTILRRSCTGAHFDTVHAREENRDASSWGLEIDDKRVAAHRSKTAHALLEWRLRRPESDVCARCKIGRLCSRVVERQDSNTGCQDEHDSAHERPLSAASWYSMHQERTAVLRRESRVVHQSLWPRT
jgi:hypothetical protein